ncbi:MAG: DsrE family protein [Candidatus Cloacimonetes bacterium]|nr:DsrE family protein [Candidatus Cloacimonadota bacterium]MCA9786589.1 DsrE family protein [Candidatus Cloacimonadota bacterium]
MTFLYLNSDCMGTGDDELGRRLLLAFLEKLLESRTPVDLVGCVNSGIRLSTEAGRGAELLARLEQAGARIASCGTCLDHFGKREQLLVGEVGSMDGTVKVMTEADRVIRPC